MSVLNPSLYKALVQRFGNVKIANEGQPRLTRTEMSGFDHKPREIQEEAGEQYKVCCPYCGDSRFRLYISHRWNTKTPAGKTYGKYLINCFNEGCDQVQDFEYELLTYAADKPVLSVTTTTAYKIPTEVTLPGTCIPLRDLPDSHPAIQYVISRKFDPKMLSDKWDVKYCVDTPMPDREGFIPGTRFYVGLVRNRLVVPITYENKLVGWQTRAIDEHSKPKYYTMPGLSKNSILFNADKAKNSPMVVVVEGVFDAFRVGDKAVALLGKSMSAQQRRVIYSLWGCGACCVMLDSDAIDDMQNTTSLFTQDAFKWGVFSVVLPDGEDPASMDEQALWSLISSYARSRGIPLTAC